MNDNLPKNAEDALAMTEVNRDAALKEFNESDLSKFILSEADYLIGELIQRKKSIEKGQKTYSLPTFVGEEIARVLMADTFVAYLAYDDEAGFDVYGDTVCSPAAEKQDLIFLAFREYALAGAKAAKSINSSSLRVWVQIIDLLDDRSRYEKRCFLESQALRILKLERAASDLLRWDIIAREI